MKFLVPKIFRNQKNAGEGKDLKSTLTGIFTCFYFYLAGISILFPYTMLITITDFWNYKFRDISKPYNSSNDEYTELQKNFPGYLSTSGNVPLTVLAVVTALFGNFINIKRRLLISSFTMGLAYVSTTVIAGLNADEWQDTAFILVMTFNVMYSAINAVFQISFLGNLGRFPPRYIGWCYDGTGMGALLSTIVNIIIIATNPDKEYIGVFCMMFGVVVIYLQFVIYLFISKTDFYIKHSGCTEENKNSIDFKIYGSVLRQVWIYTSVTFLTYAQNISAFPSITALIKPVSQESNDWNDKYFTPVCCFFLQSFMDWLGRTIATVTQWPKPGKWSEYGVLVLVLLRTFFIPLIMLCNIAPENRSTSILFESDISFVLIFAVHSLLGGWLGNVSMMLGPNKVSGYEQEVAGTILTIALVFGLGTGSLVGPALVQLL